MACLFELALESPSLMAELEEPTEIAAGIFALGAVVGDRYRIRGLLGRGGMGEVWRAVDQKLRVDVALKALHLRLSSDERALRTLREEVRAARQVVSPNVCRVFDLEEVEGRELVSMEYVDGLTLLDILRMRAPLELVEALEIASQFLAGLEAIHRAGLVHRDIKPENIMMTRSGRVVIMDFGVAKGLRHEGANTVSGTPAYMAPEQARGEAVSARADIFSSGVVLAEMVAPGGLATFEAREKLWQGIHEDPPRLPESPWAPVIALAVARRPDERYAGAAALTRALEEVTLRAGVAEGARPYPGLASFSAEDAEYFFGRELEVEEMWKRLQRGHLLGLIGPSGAGKSSFVRAGLLPVTPTGWRVLLTSPGARPFTALGQALAAELAGDAEAVRQLVRFDEPEVALSVVGRWRERYEQAVLVVDQFEELFTQSPPEVQADFAQLLGRLTLEADVRVLLSLRDDFLFHCQAHEALRPLFSELMPLGPLTPSGLRRALVQPALKCGYKFEDDALVEAMVADVGRERGALPLLAFAASRLWDRRDRERGLLTEEAYEQVGGVAGALAQHAEATLERIGHEQIPLVREIFRNLVTGQGTRATRERRDLLSVFSGEERTAAEEILDTLVAARLLTAYELAEGQDRESSDQRIEISHESLLSNWPRLVRWRTQDADGAQLRDQVRQAAQLWLERARSEDLLWSGTAYREFELWRERYAGGLSEQEEAFAAAMASKATRQRRWRRLVVAAVVILALGVAAVTSWLWQRSESARQRAVDAARRSESSRLLARAELRQEEAPTEALAWATASLELADSEEARRFALKNLWEAPPALETELGDLLDMRLPVFSPDGRRIAIGSHADRLGVVSAEGAEGMVALPDHPANTAKWSSWASSELLVTEDAAGEGGYSENAHLWRLPEGRKLRTFEFGGPTLSQTGASVLYAATREGQGDGKWLRLRSWSLPDGGERDLGRARSPLGLGSAFVPDGSGWVFADGASVYLRPLPSDGGARDRLLGRHGADVRWIRPLAGATPRLFSLDLAGEIRVWDFSAVEPRLERVIPSPEGGPALRLPDPSGRWVLGDVGFLANFPSETQARVWDLEAWPEARPLTLRRGTSWYAAAADFDPHGQWLAVTTGKMSRLTVWPLSRPRPWVVDGASILSRQLAFSPDGRWLGTKWPGQDLRLWPMPGSGTVQHWALALPLAASDFAFGPRGEFLLVVRGNSGWVVPAAGGPARDLETTPGEATVWDVAVSPSGRRGATAFGYGTGSPTLRVWDLETGRLRLYDLPEGTVPEATGYRGAVLSLVFTDESTLLTAGDGGVLRWDLDSGEHEQVLARPGVGVTLAGGGSNRVVVLSEPFGADASRPSQLDLLDFATGETRPLPAFLPPGSGPHGLALAGSVLVVGDGNGVLRVGSVDAEEPHLLLGHEGPIDSVAISPNGRWIASTGEDDTLRLWPMPDLSAPPLHTLPREELIAKLKSLTNIRVVRAGESEDAEWSVTLDPFPGWRTPPEW